MGAELVRAAQIRRGLQPLVHVRSTGAMTAWCGLHPRGGFSLSREPGPTCTGCIDHMAKAYPNGTLLPWGVERPGRLPTAEVIRRDREVAAILGRSGSIAEIAALYPEIRGGS